MISFFSLQKKKNWDNDYSKKNTYIIILQNKIYVTIVYKRKGKILKYNNFDLTCAPTYPLVQWGTQSHIVLVKDSCVSNWFYLWKKIFFFKKREKKSPLHRV